MMLLSSIGVWCMVVCMRNLVIVVVFVLLMVCRMVRGFLCRGWVW